MKARTLHVAKSTGIDSVLPTGDLHGDNMALIQRDVIAEPCMLIKEDQDGADTRLSLWSRQAIR